MYITPIPLLALTVSLFLSPIAALPGTNANKSNHAASSSSSSSSRIASASATTGTRTNHRNAGNQYDGGDGLESKGNMVCTGKCWYSREELQCREPYVPMVNENDDCYLCCVTDDAPQPESGSELDWARW